VKVVVIESLKHVFLDEDVPAVADESFACVLNLLQESLHYIEAQRDRMGDSLFWEVHWHFMLLNNHPAQHCEMSRLTMWPKGKGKGRENRAACSSCSCDAAEVCDPKKSNSRGCVIATAGTCACPCTKTWALVVSAASSWLI
jgi:hypothetical protein